MMLETINKTREYLDYIEVHYMNVQKAWAIVQEKCHDMNFIVDSVHCSVIDTKIKSHDLSKLYDSEFVQFRRKFYPTESEKELASLTEGHFQKAWEHHYTVNTHHPANWMNKEEDEYTYLFIVETVCDLMAMSMALGGTALEYYTNNKDTEFNFEDRHHEFIMNVLETVYDEN